MTQNNLKDGIIDRIRKATLPDSKINIQNISKVAGRMTRNGNTFYNNSIEDKDVVLHHLNQKFLKVKSVEDVVVDGRKNLLYFTIFLDDSYLELLNICLKSIVANTPDINFDVLFITDTSTKAKIEQFEVISNFRADYMLLPTPASGPIASLKKLNIFSYEKIADYSKILFFDVDIVCIKNLNIIFEKNLLPEKLYVSVNKIHKSPLLLSPTHGIMYLSKEDAAFLNDNPDSVPFNAGQFMFLNSSRMKNHFENILWLKNVWPDIYFYEQSFMNYYFVLRSLTCPLNTTKIPQEGETFEQFENQLVSVTFNPGKNTNQDDTIFLNIMRLKRLAERKNLMTVSGATNSNFSTDSMLKTSIMPEGVLINPILMHNENTVAIHFAATLPSGVEKKTFITLYANAHKLHI